MNKLAFVCSLTVFLSACSEDDGTAPEISNLSFEPEAVPAGQQTNVSAYFDFTDPDGDVDRVEVTLAGGGQTQTLDTDLMGASGMTEGMAQVILLLTAQSPLPLDVNLVAIDEAGNRSNTLSGTVVEEGTADAPCVDGSCTELEPSIEDAFVVY